MKAKSKIPNHGLEKSTKSRRKLSVETRSQSLKSDPKIESKVTHDFMCEMIAIKAEREYKAKAYRQLFLAIGLAVSMLLVNIAFNWKFYDDPTIEPLELIRSNEVMELIEAPSTTQPQPPPPQIQKHIVFVEVDEEMEIEKMNIVFDVEVSEETSIQEIVYEEPPLQEVEDEEVEEIFEIVEHSPQPVGGMAEFYKYVSENLQYPRRAARENIQGRVFVRFVVSKTGKITDVEVIKGIGGGCDEVAKEILENAPVWEPGRQRGKAVNVRMILPITFRLANL